MTWTINLTTDIGEGSRRLANDEELLSLVPSVSIACGFHAGGPEIMRRLAARAVEAGVDVGAYVAGRSGDDVLYQIGALNAFVQAEGGALRHVKPHPAVQDEESARALLEAIVRYDDELIVIAGQGWPHRLGAEYGLTVIREEILRPDDAVRQALSRSAPCLRLPAMPVDAIRRVRRRLAEEGVEVVRLALLAAA